MKHHFTIHFTDGRRDTTIYTKLVADSPAYYLTMENKSVRKKDSGRIIRIYPSQTKYIAHEDPTTGNDFVGMASDSCWLFKVITGKINAYTNLAGWCGDIAVTGPSVSNSVCWSPLGE